MSAVRFWMNECACATRSSSLGGGRVQRFDPRVYPAQVRRASPLVDCRSYRHDCGTKKYTNFKLVTLAQGKRMSQFARLHWYIQAIEAIYLNSFAICLAWQSFWQCWPAQQLGQVNIPGGKNQFKLHI